ncbi:hypothetical protein [Arthrobacter sp. NPDC089319]|uniref:hypothetical protein n=1 Tax=Arthrobacter sp. NPDC089319 TaxID=3155915 RepID=UPI00342BC287
MAIEKSNYARNPKPRPISVPKLHHATFMTLDVDAMVRWYDWSAACSRSITPNMPRG